MKTRHLISLTLLFATASHAAALKRAEFTKIINDVKTVAEQTPPSPAKVGQVVEGKTSVTTGAQSRAELRFEDKTITRLGANSVFNLEQGSRTVDLKQGVMLMQVPKMLGGAKVRTAAVTAAVTGTTIMVEYMPDGYIKMIVLEGEMDVFRNDKPDVFSTIHAGDMIVMKPNAKEIPMPVQVDLQRLKKTSKLTNDKEFGELGNKKELQGADNEQKKALNKGDLTPTSLEMSGAVVVLNFDDHGPRDLLGNQITVQPGANTNTDNGGQGQNGGVNKFGLAGLIGGHAVISETTSVNTDPTITTSFDGTIGTGQGMIFRPGVDGAGLGAAAGYGATRGLPNMFDSTPSLDQELKDMGSVAVFRFDQATLIGGPQVNTAGGPSNLLLASDTNFFMTDTDPFTSATGSGSWDLASSGLKNVIITARENVVWDSGFTVQGTNQNMTLYTQEEGVVVGPPRGRTLGSGDIVMTGGAITPLVSLSEGKFQAHAARDVRVTTAGVSGTPTVVYAQDVNLSAGRNATIGSNLSIKATNTLNVTAQGSVTVLDSTQLRRLSGLDPLDLRLLAVDGNVNLQGTNSRPVVIDAAAATIESVNGDVNIANANISGDFVSVRTRAPNGTLLIGNSRLSAALSMKLYAEGSNGMVRFNGNTTLTGPTIISGKTVQVDSGVSVTVSQPNKFDVYSDIENFNKSGYGNFTNGTSNLNFVPDTSSGPHKHNFGSTPRF